MDKLRTVRELETWAAVRNHRGSASGFMRVPQPMSRRRRLTCLSDMDHSQPVPKHVLLFLPRTFQVAVKWRDSKIRYSKIHSCAQIATVLHEEQEPQKSGRDGTCTYKKIHLGERTVRTTLSKSQIPPACRCHCPMPPLCSQKSD